MIVLKGKIRHSFEIIIIESVMKGGNQMWIKPEYEIINTASEVTMYSYIGK